LVFVFHHHVCRKVANHSSLSTCSFGRARDEGLERAVAALVLVRVAEVQREADKVEELLQAEVPLLLLLALVSREEKVHPQTVEELMMTTMKKTTGKNLIVLVRRHSKKERGTTYLGEVLRVHNWVVVTARCVDCVMPGLAGGENERPQKKHE
jgi:hypothetical protein